MKQRILATAALLVTTTLLPLRAVKAAVANHVVREPGIIAMEASANSNNGSETDESGMGFVLAGFVVVLGVAGSRASVLARCKPSYQTAHKLTGTDKPENIKECDQALTLKQSNISSGNERAYAHIKRGDHSRAIASLNEAIQSNPYSAYLYSERANFRLQNLGDKHGAMEDYTKAIQLNPQNALFYFWRSQTHHALGDKPRAIEDYNQAIRLAPEDTMYYCFQCGERI